MFVVITGASRGIGLALTELALNKGHQVLAVARSSTTELESLLRDKNLTLLHVDLEKSDSHLKIREALESWPQVDVLINNAGVLLEDSSRQEFERSYLINSIIPFFVTRSLFDKLKKSSRPLSLQITSQMGSIEDNTSGGYYSYRSSKTALNMIFKSLAIDEPWLTSIQVHPGWVQTRMGGSGAPLSTHKSASGIWDIIDNSNPKMSGSFINYLGDPLPW
jgi:NAD(P)-dependent dehydrogenase (short-subunit alcohol dehydrogenase family)